MSETLKEYQNQQQRVLKLLSQLDTFLKEGSEFGLDLSQEIKNKLSNVIHNVKEDKLKIALIGGFSEGKTSIAAAWLGRIDKSNMKISAAESSDEVTVYEIGDDCLLIDTPGLYGYKEKENSDLEIEKYKDITKRYISEAHILLYVMNSKNPVKESHREDLEWLFRKLNLLSRTVFVLSRFDEVADVEDEDEYQHFLEIKKDNVTERLKDFLSLKPEEVDQLCIVAVSANPFDEGVDYWLEHPEEFKRLSHIESLQESTKNIVKRSGGLNKIVVDTRKSIFSDIIIKEIPKIEKKQEEFIEIISDLGHLCSKQQVELNKLGMQIRNARTNIKDSLNTFFDNIILQARGVGLDTASDFLDREIGEEGCRIQSCINDIFQNEVATINVTLEHQSITYDTELNSIDSKVSFIVKEATDYVMKNVKFNNKMLLAARDSIRAMGKRVGLDLSEQLKFQSHGAIKLANKLNKAVAVLNVAMELRDSYEQDKKQKELKKFMAELIDNIKKQEKEILELVDSDKFIPLFFQGYIKLEESYNLLQNQIDYYKNLGERFNSWKEKRNIIEAEFKEIQ